MQLQDQYASESAPSSSRALANFLMSSNSAEARGARIRAPLARVPRGLVSELSRIRGGSLDDFDDVDEQDLLNLDVDKPAKQAPLGKMEMPSAQEIEKLMNDPQYQEQLKQMMSDPSFQQEMRKAAEQMKEMMSPEDLKMLQDMQNDPNFQEQVQKISEQMASDPEFIKAAEQQKEAMQGMIDQTLKDPEAMKQIQLLIDQQGMEVVKSVLQGIAQMLPAESREKFETVLEEADLEEKLKSAATLEDLLK
jgi:uncharacterized protein (UPF0147 family)